MKGTIENLKDILLYLDGEHIYLTFDDGNNHPTLEDDMRLGEYNSVTINDGIQAIIFIETWDGTCGLNDLGGGCFPDKEISKTWIEMGEFELVHPHDESKDHQCDECYRTGYKIWDTKIRLPRGIWWSAYT
jgi:hypothetical protein